MRKIQKMWPFRRRWQPKPWWHYLALACIVLTVNGMMLILRLLPAFQVTVATVAPQIHLPNSMVGINTIASPLERVFHFQLQGDPCSDPNATQEQKNQCLKGNSNSGTYKDGSKIQNPISKGNALFFLTPADITIDNGSIKMLWGLMLFFVDTLLALVIALNGLRVIFAGSVFRYASAIEDLPGVLLAIIAAHISLLFMTMMIGLNNNMTEGIYTFAQTNPNIHRSASGFGAGDKKLYTLRLFFPSASQADEQTYESKTTVTWQEAVDKWPGPDALPANAKLPTGSTNLDKTQFKQDMICSVYQINFDRTRRYNLFGNGDGAPLVNHLKAHTNWMINQYNQGQENITAKHLADLKQMPDTMQQDINNIPTSPLKWYDDWKTFNAEIDDVYKNDFKYTHVPLQDFELEQNRLTQNMNTLFYLGGVLPDSNGGPDNMGDAITYSCENDATGTTFQLVPDKLDFTSLFDNLQSLGDATQIMAKILALMFLAQMIIRLFFINLYIITAPLGIACWALPGKVGQPIARLWLKGFISTVMVQFLMVVALIIIQVLLGNMLAFVGGDPKHIIGNLSDGTLRDIMRIACLWFVSRIPSLAGNAPMRTLASAGQMMGQAVGTTIAMQITHFQMVTQVASSAVSMAASAR
ncbi:hypothetical protein [Ktedonobacter sp. SOSP1-52]|uniref:hypothetical protein n=1 Tax=Ktedonobacter sp. SOSP1-52 TaxID=2778366 RepID=UPI0019154CE5|nr:hypothetical protein [Ktedonobacter sp. SOSP1-52]